jgi:transcription elongation factor Elf1
MAPVSHSKTPRKWALSKEDMDNYVRLNYDSTVTCVNCKNKIEEPVTTVTSSKGRYDLYVCDNCGTEHKVQVPKG